MKTLNNNKMKSNLIIIILTFKNNNLYRLNKKFKIICSKLFKKISKLLYNLQKNLNNKNKKDKLNLLNI